MDPYSVQITRHAIERFRERKKGRRSDTEKEIRELLGQSREMLFFRLRNDASQYFLAKEWCFVIEGSWVTTVYHENQYADVMRRKKNTPSDNMRRKKSSRQKWKWH